MSINKLSSTFYLYKKYIVVFIIFISLLSIYIVSKNISASFARGNDVFLSQGSHTINITVNSYTCKGDPLPENLPIYVKLYENNSVVAQCTGVRCTFSNITTGNYTLVINYKPLQKEEFPIYKKRIVVEENSTNLLINANVNITKVHISIVDDEGVSLKAFKGKIVSERDGAIYLFEKDKYVYLPFGEYTIYQIIYTFNTKEGSIDYVFNTSEINVTSPIILTCNKNIFATVPVAHRVYFRFFKVSGEPLTMDDIKVHIALKINDKEYVLKEVYLSSSNTVEFFGIPYGKYTVTVFKNNKNILGQNYFISSDNKEIYVYTNIISFLKMRFLDIDGNLLQKYNISIKSPLGTFNVQTNSLGMIELENVIGGTYYIQFSWNNIITITLSKQITTKGTYIINVPLKTLTISILPEFSDSIPRDTEISFFYKKNGVLIDSFVIQEEKSEIKMELYQIPIGSEYYIRVRWKNEVLNYTRIEITNTTNNIDVFVPLFDISFKIVDMNNIGLINASIKIITPDNESIRLSSDANGMFKLKHAIMGNYRITVFWKDVQVYNDVFKVTRGIELTKIIRVEVYNLHLKIYGWFNNPLKNVFLDAIITMNNVRILELNSSSSESGDILLSQIPIPKGANLKISLKYKSKKLNDLIVPKGEKGLIEKEYFMDVFLDTSFYAFSFFETLILIIILVIIVFFGLLIYRKLSYKREVAHIFDERSIHTIRKRKEIILEEIEEGGMKGFYKRLKDFLEELFYHKEEEEDEDMEIFQ